MAAAGERVAEGHAREQLLLVNWPPLSRWVNAQRIEVSGGQGI